MPRSPKQRIRFQHAHCFRMCFVCRYHITRGDLIETFSVGQGNESAEIQFDFINGNTYVYNIHFNGDGITGRDVFDVIHERAA